MTNSLPFATVALKGETGTAGVIGAIAFLPIAGFFVTGTSAELPAGTSFTGFTVNDLQLTYGNAASAPAAAAAAATAPALDKAVLAAPAVAVTPAALPTTGAAYVPTPAAITIKTNG